MKFKFDLNNKEFMNLPVEQLMVGGKDIDVATLNALKRADLQFVKEIFEECELFGGRRKIRGFVAGGVNHKNLMSCLVNSYLNMVSEEEATRIFKDSITVSEAIVVLDSEVRRNKNGNIIWKSRG